MLQLTDTATETMQILSIWPRSTTSPKSQLVLTGRTWLKLQTETKQQTQVQAKIVILGHSNHTDVHF